MSCYNFALKQQSTLFYYVEVLTHHIVNCIPVIHQQSLYVIHLVSLHKAAVSTKSKQIY